MEIEVYEYSVVDGSSFFSSIHRNEHGGRKSRARRVTRRKVEFEDVPLRKAARRTVSVMCLLQSCAGVFG